MDLHVGDLVAFRGARRDRRVFRVVALSGDRATVVCPCCGVTGAVLAQELRWLHPLEAWERIDPSALEDPGDDGAPAGQRAW